MLIGQKVTVLGAGIAGLAVARALALRGAQVTVLEQADAIREVGAGLQISPNGVRVLKALGLGDAIDKAGLRSEAVVLRDYRAGRQVVRLDLNRLSEPFYLVHRADLINLLADGAREAGVKIRLLHRVTDIALEEDGTRLTTAQGAEAHPGLLIGADGLHSILRGVLNGVAKPFFTGQVAWRAVVPIDHPMAQQATVHMGPHRHAVTYPMRGGTVCNIVAVEERSTWVEESWSQRDDPANMRAAFEDFGPEFKTLLDRVEDVNVWGLFRHPVADRWHNGHAALVGDAAHPTLPFMAQGANMALEDAWVLASCLSSHDHLGTALAAYQAARADRCRKVVDAASKNARNYHLAFPPLRFAAHTALSIAGAIAPTQMLGKFGWIYDYDAPRDFA